MSLLLHHKRQALRIVWINFSSPIARQFTYSLGIGAMQARLHLFNINRVSCDIYHNL
ncbi:protein of unknown function [Enterobacter cancerogenus]|nr:protein of unknown function [Enterobacter cancerogenus]